MCRVAALTIAGSDTCAGAGIQADLKTFAAFRVYGVCVLTAITAQNTKGIQAIYELPTPIVRQQIDSVMSDMKVEAVKTGMLGNASIVYLIVEALGKYKMTRLVVDPVFWAKDGTELLSPEGIEVLKHELLPLAYLITPNVAEAQKLCGFTLGDIASMQHGARVIHSQGAQKVLITGGPGDTKDEVCDVLYDGRSYKIYRHPRLSGRKWHGTGCTLSAAITAGLALGQTAKQAIEQAIEYVQATIRHSMQLGGGYRILNHNPRKEP